MVRFWVRDNGIGIKAEDQARLFTPFTRFDQVRTKGHGLGLSIVKKILEENGGHIAVASAQSKGTTFTVWLPETSQDVAPDTRNTLQSPE